LLLRMHAGERCWCQVAVWLALTTLIYGGVALCRMEAIPSLGKRGCA
jgi:hypothetical protein